jgi:c-di-GMP-related signal transduction protein
MFKITSQQLHALSENKKMDYRTRLARFLSNNFENASALSFEYLTQIVEVQIKEALSKGLHTERQIAHYVVNDWNPDSELREFRKKEKDFS